MLDLLKLIKDRQSMRTPFDLERLVSKQEIHQILEAAAWAPTAHNMQNFEIVVIDDLQTLQRIRDIELPVSETFIRENYRQLSFSEEELLAKKTGVLGTMFPKSWLHPVFEPSRQYDDEEIEYPLMERHNQLLSCPTLMLMLYDRAKRAPASEGDFLGIMSLGCVMENMWLMAASLGIGFHVVSSLSTPYVEGEIKQMLGIPKHLSIAMSFRLGYTTVSPKYLRVRRDIEDFVHHNKYLGQRSLTSSERIAY